MVQVSGEHDLRVLPSEALLDIGLYAFTLHLQQKHTYLYQENRDC